MWGWGGKWRGGREDGRGWRSKVERRKKGGRKMVTKKVEILSTETSKGAMA